MHWVRFLLRLLFGMPALAAAGLLAVVAVAAQFGRIDLEADVLTHFAPIFLAGSAACLAVGLFFGGRLRIAICACAVAGVVGSGALIVPELGRDTGPKARADAADQLKVIQFNAYVDNAEPSRAADWIIAQQPDVVLMEETRPAIVDEIVRRTGWNSACRRCDTTVISRRKPVKTWQAKGDGPLTAATFRDRRGEYTVVAVHNAWPTDGSDQQRQEKRIADTLAGLDRERAILGGDFNSAPWSFQRRRWDAEFGLIRRDKALFSWPARPYKRLTRIGSFPFLPIDHVYAGEGWATVRVERGPRLGSDHYPIVMILAPVARR